ncbi:MAG: DUF4199 domain-containing protein [Bacteroidales bacterium]|nr:DUF4199 domain-containing protein [Bacteroidales bacterium]
MDNNTIQPSAFLQIAARFGLFIGIAAAVAMFATLYSIDTPMLMILAIIGFVGVPVILWRALSKVMDLTAGTASFAHLWRTGTLAMSAGGLILAIISFVILKWIDPDFMSGMIEQINEAYTKLGTPEATEKLAEINKAIEENGFPTSAELSLQLFVSTVLSGSVVSIAMAAFLRARANRFRNTPPAF